MKQIVNGRLVLPDGVVLGKVLVFDKYIEEIADAPRDGVEVIDAGGNYVIPGLIDLHIHGYNGYDCSDDDATAIENVAEGILKNGVTAFLPTTMTLPYDSLEKAFDLTRKAQNRQKTDSEFAKSTATILGVHAEGPFICEKKKGAQNGEYIAAPDADFIIKNSDVIKVVTVAPDADKDFEFIKKISTETDVVLSAGHTDADYDTTMGAIDAGLRHGTHLFNAMSPITHRCPGTAGALLFSDKVSCELICDTVHVHPSWFLPVYKLKGEKLCLITDCLRAAGLPDGEYELGGQKFTLKGIECRLSDGTIAGSVIHLNKAVYNLHKSGVPFHEAVNCASLNPAKTLGIENERGQIKVGCASDLVIVTPEMDVVRIFKKA